MEQHKKITIGKVVVLLKYQSMGSYKKATFHYFIVVLQDESNVAFCEYQLSLVEE